MKVESLQKQEITKTKSAVKLCLEYSDHPETLEKLIQSCTFYLRFTGIRKHFDDDIERLTSIFSIERDEKLLEIDYGFSINDTELFTKNTFGNPKIISKNVKDKNNFFDSLLYNLLCAVMFNSEVFTSFDEFCNCFCYDNDSIKAQKIFSEYDKLSKEINQFFNEDELSSLPS